MGRFETWMATNALFRQAAHSLFIAARREAMKALNKVKQIHLCFKFVSFDKNPQDLICTNRFQRLSLLVSDIDFNYV